MHPMNIKKWPRGPTTSREGDANQNQSEPALYAHEGDCEERNRRQQVLTGPEKLSPHPGLVGT